MKIVVDINHPAHVHYFKHFIWQMQERGHEILITTIDKEVTLELLNAYQLPYLCLGKHQKGIGKKIFSIPIKDIRMFLAVFRFHPDIFIGFGSIRAAHVSRLLQKPCIALDDTEHATWEHLLYVPCTDAIITPIWFKKDFGSKHIRYDGYTELAYLHPDYFTPDIGVLDEIGLCEGDRFVIVRFVSWDASHDIGHTGIMHKKELIETILPYARVFISSEGVLPKELEPYRIRIPPERLHHLLYYATLYIGEGATTASECAVMGTHALYVNTLRLGYTDEEEEAYGLVYTFSDPTGMEEAVIKKAVELLTNKNIKAEGREKRVKLLKDKIDLTQYIIWFVEQYPDSLISNVP